MILERFMRLTAAGLNFMYHGGRHGPVPVSVQSAHAHVLRRIVDQLQLVFHELDLSEPEVASKGAFARAVGRNAVGLYPDLRSKAVDLLDSCANLDPMPTLAEEHQAVLSDPAKLFPDGPLLCLRVWASRAVRGVNTSIWFSGKFGPEKSRLCSSLPRRRLP